MTAEIHKIDLEDIFFKNFKSLHGKSLDLWVRIQFVEEFFSWGIADFTEDNFKFGHVTTFLGYANKK